MSQKNADRSEGLRFFYQECSQRALYGLTVDVCPSGGGKDGDVWFD